MGFADKYIVPQFSTKDWNAVVNNYQKQQIEAEGEYLKKELELDTIDQALQDFNPSTYGNEENTNDINYYKEFNNYKQNLLNLKNIVDKYGAQSVDRKWLYQLSKDYNNNIRPIIIAIENKKTRQDKISELEERGYRVYNDLSSINDYINMDNDSLHYYNINDYITAGKNIMKNYNATQSPSYTVEDSKVPGYKTLITSQGLSNMPTEGDDYNTLFNEAINYASTYFGLDKSKYDEWSNFHKNAVADIMYGMSQNLATPEYQLVEDPKVKKEMSDLSLWTAWNNYNNSKDNYNNANPFTGLFNLGVIYTNNDNSIYEGPISNASQVNDLFSTKVAKLANTLDKNNIKQYLTEEGREYYEKNENNDDVFTNLIENRDSYLNKSFYRDQTKGAIELEELEKLIKDPNVGIFINDDGTYNVYNKISASVDKMQNNLIAGALEGTVDINNVTGEIRSGQYIMDNNFSNLLNNNVKNIKSLTSEIIKRYNKLSTKNISEDNIKIDYDSNKQRFTLNIGEGVNLEELNNALRSFKNKDYLKE